MADTRQMLMDAAEASIRKNGYNAVSFRDLAEALDIKSSSVHYHFRKKEDLGLALVERYSKAFFKKLEQEAGASGAVDGKLKAMVDTYGEALRHSDSICLCGMLGAEISGLPESLSSAVNSFFQANIDWLKTALPSDWPESLRDTKAQHIVAALQGSMMLANALGEPDIFEKTGAQILSEFV